MTSQPDLPPPLNEEQRSRAIEVRAVREWLMARGHTDATSVTPHLVATAMRELNLASTDATVLLIHDVLQSTWEPIVDLAIEAFWKTVASRYPSAKTGDLGPVETTRLRRAAESAVHEWINLNVPESTLADRIVKIVVETTAEDGIDPVHLRALIEREIRKDTA